MLIVKAHSNNGMAWDTHDTGEGQFIPVHFRRRTGRALPGDRVCVDDGGAVAEILPRTNVFGRGAWKGEFQPLAANIDQLLIMIAPEPAPGRLLLHRYLAAARILEIPALVVVNKTDLHSGSLDAYLAECGALKTIQVSAKSATGLEALEERLANRTSLLAGQSGVGKSTLTNALIPDLSKQTAELSRVTGKGTHATTTCELHRLPGGGWLADSPGVWEYHLWRMAPAVLEKGFPEFAALPPCKFNDCRHAGEPGCAVELAARTGEITAPRLAAWRQLMKETV